MVSEYGKGVPIDFRKAIKWYTKTANLDHSNAMFTLALIHRNGEGVPKDRQNGIE